MAEVVNMPKLSDTMSVGTLVKWLKQEGDALAVGDTVAEIETDKATQELEAFDEGTLLKHYVAEGEEVAIGDPIFAVGEKGEEAPEVEVKGPPPAEDDDSDEEEADDDGDNAGEESETDSGDAEEPKSDATPTKSDSKPAAKDEASGGSSGPRPAPSSTEGGRIKASPLARKIAEDKGVDLTAIQGTGPGGRIVKKDVEAAASGEAPAKKQATEAAPTQAPAFIPTGVEIAKEETIKVSNMRASIAKALVSSKTQAPHFYLEIEVDAAPLLALRSQINAGLADLPPEQGGMKLSVNDFILKASAEALRRKPEMNRSWEGKTIKQHPGVQLAFGVAIDDGLVTPVIRDAHAKGVRQIGAEAKELIGKARSRKLKPEEMQGSTFTVTNLGMYGIKSFYGIINPGNAGILSVGATRKLPVVDDNDQITVGYRMSIGLSGDHRVIDGAVGAEFLQSLQKVIESPALILV